MTARKRARKTTHWHLTFRTHNCSSLFHHSLNWNISYATSAVRTKDVFVPSHWDARDTMNDTAWITHWIQGLKARQKKWQKPWRSSEYEYSSMSIWSRKLSRYALELELFWNFQQMLFSNLSMEFLSVYFVWKFPGVSYCLMLTFGSFALADYNTYGVGVFEVGTFYALCKIYLSVLVYVVLCCFND